MPKKYGVIDLFAGPGGLGEGFSSAMKGCAQPFKLAMSVEKEPWAHATLTLRAFVRQFGNDIPKIYYEYLKTEAEPRKQTLAKRFALRDEMFSRRCQAKWEAAQEETLKGPCALGSKAGDGVIFDRLRELKKENTYDDWIVIGGPPCQAYSLAGRARNKGVNGYKIEKAEHTYLYKEYLRVLKEIKPAVFVMENVKGILSAKDANNDIFNLIRERFSNNGGTRYEIRPVVETSHQNDDFSPQDFVVKSENYGIPQRRHRVILMGIRDDLDVKKLRPLPQTGSSGAVTVGDMLNVLPPLRSGLTDKTAHKDWFAAMKEQKALVKKAFQSAGLVNALDFLKNELSMDEKYGRGGSFVRKDERRAEKAPDHFAQWIIDKNLEGFINHDTRSHMASDLGRYLFSSIWAKVQFDSPKLDDFPRELQPRHKDRKKFLDRFTTQVEGLPAKTVTSHIAKDGHYYIHYDPRQCRSLTVREAARLQTFPDNYFFEGGRTQQYVQVGNAVPPWLAKQIADVVLKLLD